jgi:hypothetical protein
MLLVVNSDNTERYSIKTRYLSFFLSPPIFIPQR